MPAYQADATTQIYYEVDDYTDPWRRPETVLLLHGAAERGAVWYAWVPHLARQYRVVRPDMRGFGASTPMARDYPWSLDILVDDYVGLMRSLGAERWHLVGAKLGATVARRLAARCPERVRTLSLVGAPPPRRDIAEAARQWIKEFDEHGVEHWARRTMAGRLGSRFPDQGVEWWIKLMGKTAASTMVGFVTTISQSDIVADLPRIACPTLVITTEGSALGSVEETRAWQQRIPHSQLLALPGNSFHVAASDADRCAAEVLAFISENDKAQ